MGCIFKCFCLCVIRAAVRGLTKYASCRLGIHTRRVFTVHTQCIYYQWTCYGFLLHKLIDIDIVSGIILRDLCEREPHTLDSCCAIFFCFHRVWIYDVESIFHEFLSSSLEYLNYDCEHSVDVHGKKSWVEVIGKKEEMLRYAPPTAKHRCHSNTQIRCDTNTVGKRCGFGHSLYY